MELTSFSLSFFTKLKKENLLWCTLSPDSVQLAVVSIMRVVAVGGSGGARDEQGRKV